MMRIPEPYRRYLNLIGIENPREGIAGLEEIVHNHLCRVPFENVSKLILFGKEDRGRPFTLSEFLDGIEHRDFGGTCHSSNPYLADLLNVLGYKAHLLGADMEDPNVHTCIRAKVDDAEYHIDVGYAGPFRKPMRLDQIPREIQHGCYTYRLDRNKEDGRYEVAIFSGKEQIHGYVVNGEPRTIDFFEPTIRESFETGNTFMSCLRITRFFDDYAVEVKDRTLINFRGSEATRRELASMEEMEHAVANNLKMPRCPVKEAIVVLEKVMGKPFFKLKSNWEGGKKNPKEIL